MLASMPRAEMRLAPSSAGVGGGVEEVAEAASSSSAVCRIDIDGQQPEHGLLDAIKLYGATPSTSAQRLSSAERFRYVGQRARAVKGMHSKCIGLSPREFESHRCRFCHSFRGQKLCPGHPLGPFFDEDSDFQLHFG